MYENAARRAAYEQYLKDLYSNNSEMLVKFKKQFFRAIQKELTQRQHDALIMHCLNGESQKDIALNWNVNPSVVCRHIKRAKGKLKRLLEYNLYFNNEYSE